MNKLINEERIPIECGISMLFILSFYLKNNFEIPFLGIGGNKNGKFKKL